MSDEAAPKPEDEPQDDANVSGESADTSAAGDSSAKPTEEQVVAVLKTVYDPEIPVDIHELGLIYHIDVTDDHEAKIQMTLTSPNCPAAESLPGEVEQKVGQIEGVTKASVEIVWDPTWTPDRMSEAAKLELGMW